MPRLPAQTSTPPRAAAHFVPLDGVRALAATAVLVVHCATAAIVENEAYAHVVIAMRAAVPLFFSISGFLLYRQMLRERVRPSARLPLREYFRRRVVRIVPGYWAALTLATLLFGLPGVFGSRWWQLYGFGQIYTYKAQHEGLGVAWTLCVEVTFYVLLPFLAAAINWLAARFPRVSPWRVDVAVLTTLFVLSNLCLVLAQRDDVTLVETLPSKFSMFVPGMLFAVASLAFAERPPERWPRILRVLREHVSACWIAGAALCLLDGLIVDPRVVALNPGGLSQGIALADNLLQIAATLLLLAPAMLGADGRALPLRLLTARGVVWLGTVSYGTYLWHVPIRNWLIERGVTRLGLPSTPTLAVCTFVLAVAFGAASWYLLERPLMRRFASGANRRLA